MQCTSITFSRHAIQRMFQRGLAITDIEVIVQTGVLIEDYPTDFPYPSCLLLGHTQAFPVHVVAARDPASAACIVVTVYVPIPARWSADFKTRRVP